VVILTVPDGALEEGDVVAWVPCWFAQAANGGTAAVSTATPTDTPFFMGRAYPHWALSKRFRSAAEAAELWKSGTGRSIVGSRPGTTSGQFSSVASTTGRLPT
jgi:hypothetical protein